MIPDELTMGDMSLMLGDNEAAFEMRGKYLMVQQCIASKVESRMGGPEHDFSQSGAVHMFRAEFTPNSKKEKQFVSVTTELKMPWGRCALGLLTARRTEGPEPEMIGAPSLTVQSRHHWLNVRAFRCTSADAE